jgi:hypothetical protein
MKARANKPASLSLLAALRLGARSALDGVDLGEVDFRRVDLSRAELPGLVVPGAKLCMVDLYEADLRGADLHGADLSKTSLRGANLTRADLRGADLRLADLSRATLCRADLRGATLSRATLSRATLCGADLRQANLEEADLLGANLGDTRVRDAVLNPRVRDAKPESRLPLLPSRRLPRGLNFDVRVYPRGRLLKPAGGPWLSPLLAWWWGAPPDVHKLGESDVEDIWAVWQAHRAQGGHQREDLLDNLPRSVKEATHSRDQADYLANLEW